MKKNNKGFTMVELIIVLAIMGVLLSVISFSASILLRNESREASSKVNALLASCKIESLSGVHDSRLEIFLENGEYKARLYQSDSQYEEEILGAESLSIIYKLKGDDIPIEIGNDPLVISFNKETAALESAQVTLIDFNAGYQITLYPTTGYFELNK